MDNIEGLKEEEEVGSVHLGKDFAPFNHLFVSTGLNRPTISNLSSQQSLSDAEILIKMHKNMLLPNKRDKDIELCQSCVDILTLSGSIFSNICSFEQLTETKEVAEMGSLAHAIILTVMSNIETYRVMIFSEKCSFDGRDITEELNKFGIPYALLNLNESPYTSDIKHTLIGITGIDKSSYVFCKTIRRRK
jgi:hypothetical protein